jgi:hypothetical protein
MVIYEVSAIVSLGLVPEYERYMREQHVPDVLAAGCFIGAAIVKAGENRYRILYEVADEATLRRYLDEHAPALRADFARHFPTGVELSREIWRVMERWPRQALFGFRGVKSWT